MRAALSIAEITSVFMKEGMAFSDAFLTAALMSLPTRIEIEHGSDEFGNGKIEQSIYAEVSALIRQWVEEVLEGNGASTVKKKN